jgi:hypothetical protein
MNTDPPADLGPGTPGLDQLLGLLTAGPTPDELARRNSTLAMYRHNIRPVAPRRRAPVTRRMQFALAAAAAVIAFAVAAYAEALPGPVQHVAYRVLGFAGVPDAPRLSSSATAHHPGPAHHHPAPGGSTSSRTPAPPPGATSTSAPPHKSASPRPTKRPPAHSGPVTLTLTTTDTQIAAGAAAVFTGSVAQHGRGVSGVPVGLFEHAAGHPGRHLAATATTGTSGQAVLRVTDLTANARFWLAGPHHARSKPVRVIVIPAVSVSLTSGPRSRAVVLTAQSPQGGQDDAVVLQVERGGAWHNLRVRLLNDQGQARFAVRRHSVARVYRVVMIATAYHGRSVSNEVSVDPL